MKIKAVLILSLLVLSCQSLPKIIDAPRAGDTTCPFPFLKERQRLIHAIEIRLPGNITSTVIGITLADPVSREVSCAIMTAEGMVLFEAEENSGLLTVNRALPPFNSENFSRKMIDDIKLMFFAPKGKIYQSGLLTEGETVCRWLEDDGKWIDVSASREKDISVKLYTAEGALKRHIKFISARDKENIYQRVELHAEERTNYSLVMTLIEAQSFEN